MQTIVDPTPERPRLTDLMRQLPEELKMLIRQELALAKAEMTEKARHLKSALTMLGAGAGMAAVASTIGMAALGFLAAFGLFAAGLPQLLANALGFLGVSIVFAGIGFFVARRAARTLAEEGIVPQKTLQTMRSEPAVAGSVDPQSTPFSEFEAEIPASEERRAEVDRIQQQMNRTVEEIQARLRPDYLMNVTIPREVQLHPMRVALIGLGTAVAGMYAVKRIIISPVRSVLRTLFR